METKDEQRILGSVWFTLHNNINIGVVLFENCYEQKAYIGQGKGTDQKYDESEILKFGVPFPLKQAQEMCGGRTEMTDRTIQ